MSPQNKALWLQAKQDPVMVVKDAPYSAPAADELIIRTTTAAINLTDNALQQTGMLISNYPNVLGCDSAGVVEEVGSNLTDLFQKGDRVVGQTGPIEAYKCSSFQNYVNSQGTQQHSPD